MEIPDGLDPDDTLTFVIGAIARTEAQLLRALLEVDLTLQGFVVHPWNQNQDLLRPYGDIRSGGLVLDGISQKLAAPTYELIVKRATETIEAVKTDIKARNYVVHTVWERSGDDHVPHHVFNDLWGPRSIDVFVNIAARLQDHVQRVDLLRGDIEAAQRRARI